MKPRMLLLAALVLTACNGGNESGETAGHDDPLWCGDIDDAGGETGDVPNILGSWQGSVAVNYFDEKCGLAGLDAHSVGFLNGTIDIEGHGPDGFKMIFQGDRANKLKGIVSPTGGVNFTGRRPTAWGVMNLAVGGLLYSDAYLDKSNIQGFVYAGIDLENDQIIDCNVWADWRAFKTQ